MEKKSALGLASKNMIPIPKRKMASKEPHLEECKIGGREEIEIKAYLSQCLLDPNDNLKMCEFTKICLIYNPSLLQSFSEKRREMKSLGRRGQELEVGFGFLVVKHSATVESIYRQGLCVNHCDIKALGDPSQGVYLTRHIDICLKVCIQRGLLRGTIVIFKVLYGRVKSLIPRTQHDKPLEPSCNYDCHIPQKVPKINEPLNLQVCSLVYLYEYDSIMLPVKRPRQCLPYAVINMHQTFTGAKATPRASLTSSWSLPTVLDYTKGLTVATRIGKSMHAIVVYSSARGNGEPRAQNGEGIDVSRDPRQRQRAAVCQISVDTESPPQAGTNPERRCLNTQIQAALNSAESAVTDLLQASSSARVTFSSMSDHRASEPGFSRNDGALDENHANGETIVPRSLNKYGSFEIPQSETFLGQDLQMLNEPASANNMNVKHSQQSTASQFNNQSRGGSNCMDYCADYLKVHNDSSGLSDISLNNNSLSQHTESPLSQPSSPPELDLMYQVPSIEHDSWEDSAPSNDDQCTSINVHYPNTVANICKSDIQLGFWPKKEYVFNLSNVLLNANATEGPLELNQMMDSCEKLLSLFVGDLQESLGEPLRNVFMSAPLLQRFGLRETCPSVLLEGSALETYVELQMLLETTHYIQNRLNFLKGLPRFRTLLWYETSLGMESLEYTFAGTLVNCHELSNLKKEIYAARARLSRCTANHYLLLKCNAESLEYEHLETRRLKSSILPHPPQSGMVNLGNSVGELEAQRKCIQHLLGKLFFAPATDRNVEKIEHLNLIISTIKRKQQWLKSNQYTALDPKQISKFGMDHLEWNAAKMLVCQELKAKEPFDKKDSQEIFSEVKERLRKMTANDVVPDVRAAVEDAKDWHKFLQSFSFPRTISISIQTPRSDNGSGHCSVVAVPGSEGNTAPKSLPSAEAHGSDSGNNMEQVAAAALTSRQHTQSTKHSNGSSRHREEYPADLPTKRTRFSFDSDIHGVGLHASSSDVALLEEQPCVKTRNVENATGETHAQLQLFECPTLVIQTGDANLQILRQEGEQDEKYEDKMPGNSIHTTVDQAEVKFAPADPGWDGEDCSTQIQELQSNPQPNSTESCAESVFEVWDTPEWFPARCRQTMKN
ncbi:uncharacterized protein LOC116952776 isoform X1 [Petromyzon marinus]|uniref:Testis-expressed protein 15 n=1 Tax=Petromyzon marinus TaxID=7757 RepID=A0AAJ7U227_PETMA|nr:testis-expressed protein 15 [Petromyzon marinus]